LVPLRFGPPECFGAVKAFLDDSGYTEQACCERLGLGAQHEILTRGPSEPAPEIRDAAGLLMALFLVGARIEEKLLRELLPAAVLDSMVEIGLLASDSAGVWHAPVCLYAVRRLYIASDRWSHPDGSHFTPPADIVYPAITKNTYRFMRMLPSDPCERFLDVCSGSGIAALEAASTYAARAWAVDITGRCTAFAEFNRQLNGIDNATVLEGDLFDPVAGLTFDRIVAHPPYVPATATKWIFQDAGAVGEEIVRGIVAGLPRHLSPGGRFYCLSLGVERKDEPLEKRVRGWLGESESQFDVMVALIDTHSPEHIASQALLRGEIEHSEFAARKAAFAEAGVEQFVYGLTVIQRVGENGRRGFTVRRQTSPRTASAELEWALRWESQAASPAAAPLLLAAKPVPSKNLELRVLHRVEQGALTPADFALQVAYPFNMECQVHPWTAALIEACDGSRTGLELHSHCLENGWIPAEITAEKFAGFLSLLVSGGLLEVEGFQPPEIQEPT
jgi:SAM-dependent methyltransferase